MSYLFTSFPELTENNLLDPIYLNEIKASNDDDLSHIYKEVNGYLFTKFMDWRKKQNKFMMYKYLMMLYNFDRYYCGYTKMTIYEHPIYGIELEMLLR